MFVVMFAVVGEESVMESEQKAKVTSKFMNVSSHLCCVDY